MSLVRKIASLRVGGLACLWVCRPRCRQPYKLRWPRCAMSDKTETIDGLDPIDKRVWDARVLTGAAWGDIATRHAIPIAEVAERFNRANQWQNPDYDDDTINADLLAAYRHLDTVAARALAEAQVGGDPKDVRQAVKLRLDVLDRVADVEAGVTGPGSNRLADAIADVLDAGARRLAAAAVTDPPGSGL